jgi:Cd2+/Zn2+-exporting ATPase
MRLLTCSMWAMARRGVLIKGGAFLEAIGKLKALAVDKTSTITEGRPRVTRVVSVDSTGEAEIVRIAAAIDTHSDHRLAQALVKYAEERGVDFPRSENYQARTGRDAEAEVGGHHYFVGNHRFTHELAVCSDAIANMLEGIEARANRSWSSTTSRTAMAPARCSASLGLPIRCAPTPLTRSVFYTPPEFKKSSC